jgi:tRNA A37 threonylcarbamoyladenosine dehydratase
MRWYSRTELLLGEDALERLRGAKVAVFGLGGVGGFAVEALARAGVGTLRLVDHDVVSGSNLNRQIFALRSTLGQAKVDVAKARVLDINPDCQVEARRTFINADSLPELLEGGFDVVVDAIDSVSCKVALLHAANQRGIFTVSSMGAGGRLDASNAHVADLSRTRMCPLAAIIRKKLRKLGLHKGIRCVYSLEPADNKREPNPLDSVPHVGPGRERRPLGTISYMPALFGLRVAEEALKHLLQER